MPGEVKVGAPHWDADSERTTMHPVGDQTNQRQFTAVKSEIASLPGVATLEVEIVPPAGRRVMAAMISRSCACSHLHFFRGELGVRRTPCGKVVVLIAEVNR